MNFDTILGRVMNPNWIIPVLLISLLEDALVSRNVGGIGDMIGRRSNG